MALQANTRSISRCHGPRLGTWHSPAGHHHFISVLAGVRDVPDHRGAPLPLLSSQVGRSNDLKARHYIFPPRILVAPLQLGLSAAGSCRCARPSFPILCAGRAQGTVRRLPKTERLRKSQQLDD